MIKSFTTAFAVLLLAGMPTMATAGISVGVDSDYLFRGVSQTDGDMSAWTSYDHAFGDSGFMVGAWLGQVDYADGSDLETDLYAMWSNDWLNVGYIDYSYNGDSDLDGSEIYMGTELMGVSVDYYMGQDDYTDYMEFGYSVMGFDLSFGMWDEVGDNMKISKSFDLPMGLEGSLAFVDFTADSGSSMMDEDTVMFSLSKSF
jgi:uncharacterized protein (TIGR02001 family)|tara:strand:- start:486 stop:1088 length:603 start_codon:yes stop_codon:yes gene_type:complete